MRGFLAVSVGAIALAGVSREAAAGSARLVVSATVVEPEPTPPRPTGVSSDAVPTYLWIDGELEASWLIEDDSGAWVPAEPGLWCVRSSGDEPERCTRADATGPSRISSTSQHRVR